MNLFDYAELYDIIVNALPIENNANVIDLRRRNLDTGIKKIAFDTRRINQEIEFNPRRGLQYYQRSQPFMTDNISNKIKSFLKLKNAVDVVKEKFIGSPEWLDSYCRILHATINRTLRVDQKDFDYSDGQLDYLQELLYLRYRLSMSDIELMTQAELEDAILLKDDRLRNNVIYGHYNSLSPTKTATESDPLIEKLLNGVRASGDNRDVERSVTITVRDKINDNIKKEG